MSHVTHTNDARDEPSHTWKIRRVTHIKESCHTNESCYTYKWVMSHIRMIHVTQGVTYMGMRGNLLSAYQWFMSQKKKNDSYHTGCVLHGDARAFRISRGHVTVGLLLVSSCKYLSSKSPIYSQKSPVYPQKSPYIRLSCGHIRRIGGSCVVVCCSVLQRVAVCCSRAFTWSARRPI